MKQRPRQTGDVLWLPKADPADIKEMDEEYERIPGQLRWRAKNPAPVREKPKVEEEEVEEEEVEEEVTVTADELLADDE